MHLQSSIKRLALLICSSAFLCLSIVWVRATRRVVGYTAIYYHAVSGSQAVPFTRQMRWLRRRATPVSLGELSLPQSGGKPRVLVTFDDAFVSVQENAIPILKQYGIPFCVFVPTGYLGRSPEWDIAAGSADRTERVMGAAELVALANSPLVTIGSHTVSHPRLGECERSVAARELSESKDGLEVLLHRPVDSLALPHGSCSDAILDQARSCGYSRVFTIDPRPADATDWLIGRVSVSPDDSVFEFAVKALGGYNWLGSVRSLRRRLRRERRAS